MKKYIFIAIFSVVIISSCQKKVGVERTIFGTVVLDAEENDIAGNYSGITVKLLGTKLETITDVDGYFEIKNVPSGNYDIKFSKQGYSAYILRNVLIMGGAAYRKKISEHFHNIILLEKPTAKIRGFNIEADTSGISVEAALEAPAEHAMLLLSKTNNISDSLFMDWYPCYVDNQNISGYFSFDLLRHYFLFEAGDTIYAVVYPAHSMSWANWENINAVYLRCYGLGYNHSEIKQFVVPGSFQYTNLPLSDELLAKKSIIQSK